MSTPFILGITTTGPNTELGVPLSTIAHPVHTQDDSPQTPLLKTDAPQSITRAMVPIHK